MMISARSMIVLALAAMFVIPMAAAEADADTAHYGYGSSDTMSAVYQVDPDDGEYEVVITLVQAFTDYVDIKIVPIAGEVISIGRVLLTNGTTVEIDQTLEDGTYVMMVNVNATHENIADCQMTVGVACGVTFLPGEGSGAMPMATVPSGTKYVLPECGFTAPSGMAFRAWQIGSETYEAGQDVPVTSDIAATALWESAPPTEDDGFPVWAIAAISAAIVLALIVVVILLRRPS